MIITIKKTSELNEKYVNLKKYNSIYKIFDSNNNQIGETNIPLKRDHYKGRIIESNKENLKIQVITYAPLHTHTGYSLLDGAIKVNELVEKTEYYGAITDHGVMYGFLDFYKKMKENEKHPVIGFEAYTEDLYGKKQSYHMILLAKNEIGYKNLIKLTSLAYDNFYKKPHVSIDMLKKYSEGIIATSACIGGLIPQLILKGEIDEAEKAVISFKNIFGSENFYIELQRHGISDERKVEPVLIEIAKKHNIKLIATADSHYLMENDSYPHEILLCLQTKKKINEKHMQFEGTGYHYMNSEEMEELFKDMPEVLDNTLDIAESCNLNIKLNDISMPDFEIPNNFKSKTDYFEYLSQKGFDERFKDTPKFTSQKYIDRFNYEVKTIKEMNFAEYFLIVWDFINYARENDIMVGPGRGSAVGSIVSYCLHITDIDPIEYNLLFERFLNPERISWPDIDTDFDFNRRGEVIDYLTKKYGEKNVCKIVTFGTEGAKMVVRDVARVLDYPVSVSNKITKLIPSEVGMTITKAMDKNPELKTLYDTDKVIKEIIDLSLKLEGLPRHASVHACGFVISRNNVIDNLPTAILTDEITNTKVVTSQVVMNEVEELGLLKMDVLGLRTMTVIKNSLKLIEKRHGKKLKMSDIPLNDKKVYKFLKEGNTSGVFQFESEGMTSLVQDMYQDIDMIPDSDSNQLFERLIAAVALYRPGPMDYIPEYIRNMNNPGNIQYDHPMLESILKNTYGVIVYQEQVMQIVQKLAKYTFGRADIVRKAMGKKKLKIMEEEEKVFLYGNLDNERDKVKITGCIANGVSENRAKKIWDKMAEFAKYAFNKSHATAYAYLAAITAWLAYYYPLEFYTALLNSVLDKSDKLADYLSQCSKKKINILTPDVNLSNSQFELEGDNIRFGLTGIKTINKSGSELVKIRGNKPFTDIQDFTQRMAENDSMNKILYEAMVYSGALDCFEGTRHTKIESQSLLLDYASLLNKTSNSNQISFFDISDEYAESVKNIDIPNLPEYSSIMKLKKEKEYTGFYLSGFPLDDYSERLKKINSVNTIEEIINISSNYEKREVETAGLISNIKSFWTKKSEQIYKFDLENNYHSVSCVVFPKDLPLNRSNIVEDKIVIVKGVFQYSDDWGSQIIINNIYDIDNYLEIRSIPNIITVSIDNKLEQDKLFKIISLHMGNDTSIVINAKNKKYPLKKKIKYSPKIISLLKDNFKEVNAS